MEAKPKKKDLLTYVNNFITNLNKKILSIPKASQQRACNILSAILDKNIALIRQYSLEGLPNELPILRAFIWKILLKYLPDEPKKWEETLISKRAQYNSYKKFVEGRLKIELETKKYNSKDILEQIIKDVYRTNTQFSFFFQPTDKNKNFNKEEILNIYNKRKNWDFSNIEEVYKYDNFENETHTDVLKRILFTYSSILQDVSYHQGMNEILAPIYYTFSYDKLYLEENEEDIEADSFWSFYFLLNGIKNNFEENQEGLFYKSEILSECVKIVDEDVYNKLLEKNIKCEFFCLRWFVVLFGQDFDMGDVIRIWDFVFSNENKNYLLFYVCLAVINLRRNVIINGEMNEILQGFQNLRDLMCDDVIFLAVDIRNKWKDKLDNIIKKTLN